MLKLDNKDLHKVVGKIMSKKILSLFSGAGGLDYGFKLAGYDIVGSAEINLAAVKTHNKNFNLDSKPIDLSDPIAYKEWIAPFKKQKIQLVIGGFPCQGYSLAGKRNVDDERNQLFKTVVKVIEDTNVEYFMLENVPGILNMEKGQTIKNIEEYFNQHNLFFTYEILDASFFNVAQKRKRVIFLGSNKKSNIPTLKKILLKLKATKNKIITVKEAISDLENLVEDKGFNHIYTRHTPKMIERITALETGKSLYKNYSDGWKKVEYNKPSPTVKENHGGVHLHPIMNRALTPRELARLQSFPDDFIFLGTKSSQLVQIGNAVPVKLAEAIGKSILELF